MSSYLVNLVLRGAGMMPAADRDRPEAAVTPARTPDLQEPFDDPFANEEIVGPDVPSAIPQASAPDAHPVTPAKEIQREVIVPREERAEPPSSEPRRPATQRIEVRNEAPARPAPPLPPPTIEVRETVREPQVIRERVIEKPVPQPTAPPESVAHPAREVPAALPTPPVPWPPAAPLAPTPELKEVIREVVREAPVPLVRPAAQSNVLAVMREAQTEKPDADAPHTPRPSARMQEAQPLSPRVPQSQVRPDARPEPTQRGGPARPEEAPQTKAAEKPARLHPAAIPDAPIPKPSETRSPQRETGVEVKIGALEIRAVTPPAPPPRPEPTPDYEEPVEELDAYRAIRQYGAWYRQ